jgi:hypothetical protein
VFAQRQRLAQPGSIRRNRPWVEGPEWRTQRHAGRLVVQLYAEPALRPLQDLTLVLMGWDLLIRAIEFVGLHVDHITAGAGPAQRPCGISLRAKPPQRCRRLGASPQTVYLNTTRVVLQLPDKPMGRPAVAECYARQDEQDRQSAAASARAVEAAYLEMSDSS